jgi:hypothetical protein
MLNNFILISCKDPKDFKNFVPHNVIDTWFISQKNSDSHTMHDINDHHFSSHDILIGCEEKYCLYSDNEKAKTVIIGDPYKLYPDSQKALLDIIQEDNDEHKVYHTIGGAFAWINLFSKEGKIKIYTDMFGQLPIFYYHNENIFSIATSVDLLLQSLPSIQRNVNIERILEFIVTGDIADEYLSFFKYIHRLRGNQVLTYNNQHNTINIDQYAPIENFRDTSFSFTPQNLKKDIEQALAAAANDKKVAYGLSGGIDSTLLASVAANQSSQSISCYTAVTGYGQDLKFSRIASAYMKAELHEVPMDYDEPKLDYITKITQNYGRPVHIWGNTIGNTILTQTAKENNCDVFINGSAEHAATGGVFPNMIIVWIQESIKKRKLKFLFDTLTFNHQHKLLSVKKVIKEIFNALFLVQGQQLVSKLKGKDFNDFFNPEIQRMRNNLQVEKAYPIDVFHYTKSYLSGGVLQKYSSQAYQSGNVSDIQVRLPFLDSRLIKYMDHRSPKILKNKHIKQLAREAMLGIMDEQVIYRKDNEGLRWKSTKLVKDNKDKIIEEIKVSPFLKNILSEKTLQALDKPGFRKSLLLSLYSVAIFDKVFHIKT